MTARSFNVTRLFRAAGVGCLCLGLAVSPGLASAPADRTDMPRAVDSAQRASAMSPQLRVSTVQGGLEIPWDIAFLPDGGMLYSERVKRRVTYRAPDGTRRVVLDAPAGSWAEGETGMMGMVLDQRFAQTRTFLTCHGSTASGSPDVRVVRWRLGADFGPAEFVRNLVTGLPATSGRHGGCRLRFGSEGALYIGTGDAADEDNAQDLTSGGGKVLRVRPGTGAGWPTNRWSDASNPMQRRVFTYGHRNVQGLALRRDGRMWSAEHGTYRDDEVNLLRNGANYGWQAGPGYDEGAAWPMTNHSLPGVQLNARWSSGNPTIAPSGATWLSGRKWGVWQGALAMAVLGSRELHILKFDADGRLLREFKPAALDGVVGRLRAAVLGPDNNLYVTTSNFTDDRILKVVPQG